jgi:hypothetical protein
MRRPSLIPVLLLGSLLTYFSQAAVYDGTEHGVVGDGRRDDTVATASRHEHCAGFFQNGPCHSHSEGSHCSFWAIDHYQKLCDAASGWAPASTGSDRECLPRIIIITISPVRSLLA